MYRGVLFSYAFVFACLLALCVSLHGRTCSGVGKSQVALDIIITQHRLNTTRRPEDRVHCMYVVLFCFVCVRVDVLFFFFPMGIDGLLCVIDVFSPVLMSCVPPFVACGCGDTTTLLMAQHRVIRCLV